MTERILVDVREAYHPPAEPAALRVPLGILLVDPAVLDRSRSYAVLGQDARDAAFAARWLREHGIDARTRQAATE